MLNLKVTLVQCFSTPIPELIWVRERLWLSPQAPGASKFSVMLSDNNDFAVSHDIYTFEVVWSIA